MSHLSQLQQIRDRARRQIAEGAVTPDYALDKEQAVGILNEALATELVCVLRYRFHYFMATGIHSNSIRQEFMEHAQEEQEHADRIAERIRQLGGKPQMNPAEITALAHSEYKEGTSLADMIREDLIAERIAVESYREIIRYFGEKDSTSRILMEEILAKEEEHADEMADLLFAVDPSSGKGSRPMYFADEVAANAKAGGASDRKAPAPGSKPS